MLSPKEASRPLLASVPVRGGGPGVWSWLWFVAVSLFWSNGAWAEVTIEQCAAAYVKGQEERLAGRYLSAEAEFRTCAAPTCPDSVIADCETWLTEVELLVPSFVPMVVDAKGHPILGYRLFVDGVATEVPRGSRPLRVNVGAHVLRFEAEGFKTREVVFNAREREREASLRVQLSAFEPHETSPKKEESSQAGPSRQRNASKLVAMGLASGGIVALGVSGVMGLLASSQYKRLEDDCAPKCTEAETDSLRGKVLASDVALGVGSALLVTSIVVYFAGRPAHRNKVAVSVAPARGGGRTVMSLHF